jgi:hypothetical protein
VHIALPTQHCCVSGGPESDNGYQCRCEEVPAVGEAGGEEAGVLELQVKLVANGLSHGSVKS